MQQQSPVERELPRVCVPVSYLSGDDGALEDLSAESGEHQGVVVVHEEAVDGGDGELVRHVGGAAVVLHRDVRAAADLFKEKRRGG